MKILNIYIYSLICVCEGYNFLVATPNAVKSENTLVLEIVKGLLHKGHKVTFVPSSSISLKHENLTAIWIPDRDLEKYLDPADENPFEWKVNLYDIIGKYYGIRNKVLWEDERMHELWKKRNSFDLFLTLSWFSESTFPFLMDNKIPYVQMLTAGSEPMSLLWEGNIVTPAVLPSLLVSYCEHMNFWERSINFVSTIQYFFNQKNIMDTYLEPVKAHFPDLDYVSFYDRVALTLINGHFALDGPVPLLPSQIEIGTIHTKEPEPMEKVDKELAKFMASSGDAGVIYFSLGSIAKSKDIPTRAKEMFLEAFSRIPQKVAWKYEGDDLKLPPNVFVRKWMPQQDVLGHPKTKVFISHCGNLGTQEARYHGVPVLAVPIAFDQPRNAARMVRKGYAIALEWETLTPEKIVDSLNALVNDSSYKERLTAISRILKDQKDKPVDRAVWWLEYVVRHDGAPHLQYAGKRLSLFQYIMLDVILFWTAVFGIFILGFVYAVKVICCRGNIQKLKQKGPQKKKVS